MVAFQESGRRALGPGRTVECLDRRPRARLSTATRC
jgi:hypothetical protein